MDSLNLILDFILVFAGIGMILATRDLSSSMSKSLNLIAFGALALGFAHLIETITFLALPSWDTDALEVIHRFIVLAGFVLLILGLRQVPRNE